MVWTKSWNLYEVEYEKEKSNYALDKGAIDIIEKAEKYVYY